MVYEELIDICLSLLFSLKVCKLCFIGMRNIFREHRVPFSVLLHLSGDTMWLDLVIQEILCLQLVLEGVNGLPSG